MPPPFLRLVLVSSLLVCAGHAASADGSALPPLPRTDAHGNPLRRAPTGHVSNYDEAKVGIYTLPNPLVLQNGQPVRDAATWYGQRRPELLRLYADQIYGRVPSNAPKVTFTVEKTEADPKDGDAIRKVVIGHIGPKSDGLNVTVTLYLPAKTEKPVPVLLQLLFLGDPPPPPPPGRTFRFHELGPIKEILAHGYAYADFRYTDIQPDRRHSLTQGVIGLTLKPSQTMPAPDEWGAISAWAWGASRVMDYLETDPAVDASRVALVGHSRLGKTVLWAGAQDPRFALIFSSCAGEMGSSLARRDYGETIDDIATNFPWQFAGNFQQYVGRWNKLPVDAHMLIALNVPHPVFITGGTKDQWSDPHGEFLAEVAASPVYRLLGLKGVGATKWPAPDAPLISGHLGYLYHTGRHMITPEDWSTFLKFADKYFKAKQ